MGLSFRAKNEALTPDLRARRGGPGYCGEGVQSYGFTTRWMEGQREHA